jgi:hypothetical protein
VTGGRKAASAIFPGWAHEEIEPSYQDLRDLRATFYLAQEVGKGLGRGKVLL